MNARKWRNYKKGSKIMSDINSMKKYTRLGRPFSQEPPF